MVSTGKEAIVIFFLHWGEKKSRVYSHFVFNLIISCSNVLTLLYSGVMSLKK
jgi:hypothetical protein